MNVNFETLDGKYHSLEINRLKAMDANNIIVIIADPQNTYVLSREEAQNLLSQAPVGSVLDETLNSCLYD